VRVTSAGTGPWHAGGPAHANTRRVLADAGFDTEHIAHQITREEMPTVDLLLAADRTHLAALTTLEQPTGRTRSAGATTRSLAAAAPSPDATPSRIVLFRSFDPDAEHDEIPDPYGGPHEEYLQVMSMVRAAVPGIVDEIRRRLG
jgi:protein-tyrosine phosphatase